MVKFAKQEVYISMHFHFWKTIKYFKWTFIFYSIILIIFLAKYGHCPLSFTYYYKNVIILFIIKYSFSAGHLEGDLLARQSINQSVYPRAACFGAKKISPWTDQLSHYPTKPIISFPNSMKIYIGHLEKQFNRFSTVGSVTPIR
jgi:hypothetical protein